MSNPNDGPPGVISGQPPYIPLYVDATVTMAIAADNGDGTLIQGQNTTISGTVASAGGGGQVYVYVRPIANDGYGVASVLVQADTVDTGQTASGKEIYDWSASTATSGLSDGIYDVEAFLVQTTYIGGNVAGNTFSTHPAFQYLSVVPADSAPRPIAISADSAEVSTDGRYLVRTLGGQSYERDLQTGKETALTAGEAPPLGAFAPGQSIQREDIALQANSEFSYSYSFKSADGAYTFNALGNDHPYVVPGEQPYDNTQYYSSYDGDLYPVVTNNATGAASFLKGFGLNQYYEGVPIGASDNGDVVLTQYDLLNGIGDVQNGPLVYINYINAAPSLTINPLNGANLLGDYVGDQPATLTGTSDAIGQLVEIDIGAATSTDPTQQYGTAAEAGIAVVQADGTWSFVFDPNAYATGADGLFIEASVTGADGTPSRTGVIPTLITTPPVVIGATDETLNRQSEIGVGDTVTIDLEVNEPLNVTGTPVLDLSNGATAAYSRSFGAGGYPFSSTYTIEFTYTPALGDAEGPLSITGLDTSQGAILDSANDPLAGPFNQDLVLTVQTAPTLEEVSTGSNSGTFLNGGALDVYGRANIDQAGYYVTVFDGSTEIGSAALTSSGTPSGTNFLVTTSTLGEGPHSLTAITSVGPYDPSAVQSVVSNALQVVVDMTPPNETVTGLTLDGDNHLTLSEQAAGTPTAEITLSAPLAAGVDGEPQDAVELRLPNGVLTTATLTPEGASGEKFSIDLSDYASQFGVDGSLSAFVVDGAGNPSAPVTTPFTAVAQRIITPVTATPASFSSSTGDLPSLSGAGDLIAFQAGPSYTDYSLGPSGPTTTAGIYTENLTVGASSVALIAPGGTEPSLSGDGQSLAYIGAQSDGSYALFVKSLASAGSPGAFIASVNGGYAADRPSLSADGKAVAFSSSANNVVYGLAVNAQQIYVAAFSGSSWYVDIASAPDPHSGAVDPTQGTDGPSSQPSLAGDGDSVAFTSDATNLLGNDPRAATLQPYVGQVYVKTLVDNAATGLKAGAVTLVSGAQGGNAVGDKGSQSPSMSDDGRYVVFASYADNLAPDNLAPGASIPQYTQEIYLDDLKTGEIKLVSQTPSGVVADGYSENPVISADGSTVVFSSSAYDLAGASGEQTYAWDRGTGAITLLSEPGAVPGNGSSSHSALSSDGTTVAFDSYATNLAPGEGSGSPYGGGLNTFVTTTPGSQAQRLIVTNSNDSGAGSLRAELGLAGNGDTIVFDPSIAGETIKLSSTLTVTNGVTIDGTGADITISGQGKVTDFTVDDKSTLPATIEGLTIADGSGQGAAGLDSLVGWDNPGGGGNAAGGIDLQRGSLSLDDNSFSNNSATGGVGGKNNGKGVGGSGGAAAGAIYVESGTTLSASQLTFTANKAAAGQPGDYVNNKGAGTQGASAAGAIYVANASIFTIQNSSFVDNSAIGGYGARADSNDGGGSAAGGIFVEGHSTAEASGLAFQGNSATAGRDGFGAVDPSAKAYADSNIAGSTGPVSSGGTAQDGYIVGGTVAYENGSAPSVTTGADGSFDLIGGSGPIQLTGGTDSATGLTFTGEYEAPAGSTVLSPLTTLLEAVVVAQGDASASGVAAAEKLVETAFNLPTNIDLTSYDAEGELLAAPPGSAALDTAERIFAADSYLQGTESLIDAAGGSGSAALAAVAAELAAGQSVDLTNPSTLIDLGGLTADAAAAVLKMVNATVNAVSTQISNTTDPKTAFIDLTGGNIAAQVNGVDDLLQSDGDYTDAATAYDDAINSANPETSPLLAGDTTALDNYDSAPCYVRGTRILTPRGEVLVERLAVGDLVVTASGARRPIVWIGHREIDLSRHPRPEEVRPVRIAAGALAEKIPHDDLLVSPEHALWLENAFVPARDLINGVTIRQEDWGRVVYFHVELESHDVLLAEGAPAESYLDCDNRSNFDNAPDGVTALHPDWQAQLDNRPPAPSWRLRAALAQRARALGRGAELDRFERRMRAPRTNFVRNPRGEGGAPGVLGVGGKAPDLWHVQTPAGIAAEFVRDGESEGLPFIYLRFRGVAKDAGVCRIFPQSDKTIAARRSEAWTMSCHVALAGGSMSGVETFALSLDEYGPDESWLTGKTYRACLPQAGDLVRQRFHATRWLARREVAIVTGHIHLQVAAGALINLTLSIAVPQIEQGAYASDALLPPPGVYGPTVRRVEALAFAPGLRSA